MVRSITSSLILEGAEFPRVSTQPQLVSPGAFAFNDKQGVVSSFLPGMDQSSAPLLGIEVCLYRQINPYNKTPNY